MQRADKLVSRHLGEYVTRNFGRFWYYFAAQYLFRLRLPLLDMAQQTWRYPCRDAASVRMNECCRKIKQDAQAVVGLHLRWGRGASPLDKYFESWHELESLCLCALQAARHLASERQLPLGGIKVLVASDSAAAVDLARAVLGESVLVESVGGFTRGFDIGFGISAVEMELLGLCDVLVATRSSSFSFGAHATNLVVPWMLTDGICSPQKNSQINMRVDHKAEHPWNKKRFLNAACNDNTTLAPIIDEYED